VNGADGRTEPSTGSRSPLGMKERSQKGDGLKDNREEESGGDFRTRPPLTF